LDYSPVISVKLFCGAKNAIEIKDLTIEKAYYYLKKTQRNSMTLLQISVVY